jgi:hypothetical protein
MKEKHKSKIVLYSQLKTDHFFWYPNREYTHYLNTYYSKTISISITSNHLVTKKTGGQASVSKFFTLTNKTSIFQAHDLGSGNNTEGQILFIIHVALL